MSAPSDRGFSRLRDNAFHVLGVTPEATRAEVEREGQKLLAQLQLGLAEAARYATPLGPQPRDADTVRSALAALRDPRSRLQHTLWARLPARSSPSRSASAPAWPGALVALGCAPHVPLLRGPRPPPAPPEAERPLPDGYVHLPARYLRAPPSLFALLLALAFILRLAPPLFPLLQARPSRAPPDSLLFIATWPLLILLLLFLPQLLARLVAIPLGLPRMTRFLSSLDVDEPDHQAAYAACALLRSPTPRNLDFVRQQLEALRPVSLNGTLVVAHGLLAAARGDRATARRLLASHVLLTLRATETAQPLLNPERIPGRIRRQALLWCLADAAARGDWKQVLALARRGPAPVLRAFLRLAASRLLNVQPAPRWRLGLAWAFTPRWAASTWPLLQLAWKAPTGAPPPTRAPPTLARLERALRRHADLEHVAPAGAARALQAAATAWDEALGCARVKAWVSEQAGDLGPEAAQRALGDLESEACAELTAWVLAHAADVEPSPAEPGRMLEQVLREATDGWLQRLESLAEDLLERVRENKPLAPLAEWSQYLTLVDAYPEALAHANPEVALAAFPVLNEAVLTHAEWLFNKRKEPLLARAMWRALLPEAQRVGDEEDVRVLRTNLRVHFQ